MHAIAELPVSNEAVHGYMSCTKLLPGWSLQFAMRGGMVAWHSQTEAMQWWSKHGVEAHANELAAETCYEGVQNVG